MRNIVFVVSLLLAGLISCHIQNDNKTIFIGDSLIRNWDIERWFPYLNLENRGIDGLRLEDCLDLNISENEATIVLLVGTNNINNNLSTDYIEEFTNLYIEILNKYEYKKMICISLLPRYDVDYIIIKSINEKIKDVIDRRKNVYFLDIADDFLFNEDINQEYTVDGVHLNTKGYDLLASKLSVFL